MTRPESLFPRRPAAILLSVLTLALAACNRGGEGDAHGGMAGMPPPQVGVVKVALATVPVLFEYPGQTVGAREIEIRGRVGGILERRTYAEGSVVQAGQLLFEIDRSMYANQVTAAEAEVALAEARFTQARREAARLKPLVAERVSSQKEYDDAASAEQIAAATLKSAHARLAEAKLNLDYTRVTAPISGIVGRALKAEGSLVTPSDSLLTTLVQVDPIQASFGVSETEQARIEREIAQGALRLPKGGFVAELHAADGSVLAQGGRVLFRESRVSSQTGTVDTRVELRNPGGRLRAGQFVRVVLTGATRPDAIVVPQKAVVDGPGGKMVMTVAKGPDGTPVAQPRPVEVGEWVSSGAEKAWVVRKGLAAGDEVIVDNLAKLRPGAPVSPIDPNAPPPAAPSAPQAGKH